MRLEGILGCIISDSIPICPAHMQTLCLQGDICVTAFMCISVYMDAVNVKCPLGCHQQLSCLGSMPPVGMHHRILSKC